MVDVYRQLAQYPVFTIDEAQGITGNRKTAYFHLRQLARKGLIQKVRNNIYSAINPATGQLVASRYQIACAITASAYLSHHSAFEYYGLANQVFNEVYVSSDTRFKAFAFDHVTYRYIASKMNDGVVEARHTTGVRLTDLERTVIDSIQDVNKVGGLEEELQGDRMVAKVFIDVRDLTVETVQELRLALHRSLAAHVGISESSAGIIDIANSEASKASMAQQLARSQGIPAEQVLALADNDADVTLLRWAGIGIAMGNASPAAKAAADGITSSNLRDGAAEALERWVLERPTGGLRRR